MEFSCSRGLLFDTLSMVAGVVKKNPPLPVLANVLLVADAEAGKIHLSATDLEVGISCSLAAKVETPGELTLPARKLTDILRALPEAEVSFVVEGTSCKVNCENSRFSLAGIDAEEYPPQPAIDADRNLTISSSTLREMIHQTLFAVSYDETRYFLNGVLIDTNERELIFVATDGRRLAKSVRLLNEDNVEFKGIVPTKAIAEIDKLASRVEEVKLSFAKGHIVAEFADTTLMASLIEGDFPDYKKLIPTEFSRTAHVNRGLLEDATKRIALMADESSHRIAFEFEEGLLRVVGHSDQGEASEKIEIDYSGEPLRIGFNARYVIDALKATQSAEVRFELIENLRPGLIKPEEGEDYLCLVMPMRLDEY